MGLAKDITNEDFGYLKVKRLLGRTKNRHTLWECVCKCGKVVTVTKTNLMSTNTVSCGCYKKERITKINTTHNKSKTREYNIWTHMKRRCNDPKAINYKYYGGKGIKVCDKWLNSFESFLEDMGECPKGFTLDRIDSKQGYNPINCRWASWKTQNDPKRRNYGRK